ncbi:MAG: hypothetical protein NTV80_07420 [Verrucomicrobia bacterium]|nr:hypothetical protein [Verrucomicrobiota bacterium]
MSSFADRQKQDLRNCLTSFDEQFRIWKDRTLRPPWETHFSQVIAITDMMSGLRQGLTKRLEDNANDPDLTTHVGAAWRVWEAFRARLSQRQEESFRAGLGAADEIAWACRGPLAKVFQRTATVVRPEPALVYLSGASSPVALQRNTRFLAESVLRQSLTDAANALLERLPVPLIGLPWHDIFHAPGMTSIAHEAGHVVEADFSLTEGLNKAIQGAATATGLDEKESKTWLAWRAEIFADHFAIRHCGSAFVSMLGDVLLNHANATGPEYPPHPLRMELCFTALEDMGHAKAETSRLRDEWTKDYRALVKAPAAGSTAAAVLQSRLAMAPFVVKALGDLPLTEAITLRAAVDFTPQNQEHVQKLAVALLKYERPPPNTPATHVAAAARLVFDQQPGFFKDPSVSLSLCETMLKGTDAGRRRRSGRARDVQAAAAPSPSRRRGGSEPSSHSPQFTEGLNLAGAWPKLSDL